MRWPSQRPVAHRDQLKSIHTEIHMFLVNASSLKVALVAVALAAIAGCASSFETTRTLDGHPHMSELGSIRDTSSGHSDDHGASVLASVRQRKAERSLRGGFDASFR
jgi:hypothetical protein